MNLVYIAPFLHLPFDSGGAVRAFNLIRHLALQHNVSVITYETDDKDEFPQWAKQHLTHLTRLSVHSSSASSRGRIATLQRLMSFPPESFQRYPSAPLVSAIDQEFASAIKPDMLVLDTLMTGRVLGEGQWAVPAVLGLYDIASKYQQQAFSGLNWRPFKIVHGIEWLKMSHYEKQIVRSFRTISVVSSRDGAAIKKIHPTARVLYVPNGVDTVSCTPCPEAHGDAILFVGNWAYSPNIEGLWYFFDKIWPLIRTQLNPRFLVIGRHPPARLLDLPNRDPLVTVVANVPDVQPYYAQARVCIAPLLGGEGTRLKILEAFAFGVPVVSTTVGCEGLDVQDGTTLLVADDPTKFAEAVIQLFRDPARADALSRNARALVESRYEWETIANGFQTELEKLVT